MERKLSLLMLAALGVAGPATLPAVAPVGATQALFELVVTRGASGGVMFADDASLEDTSVSVPEPAAAALALLVFAPSLARRRRAR